MPAPHPGLVEPHVGAHSRSAATRPIYSHRAQFTHGRALSAWLDYDPGFRASRLPVLFVVWGCQAVLFGVLAIRGRWTPILRRVSLGLESAVALILVWFFVAGGVFVEAAPNKAALGAIGALAFLLFFDVGVKLYRGVGRIPPPEGLEASSSFST